MDRNVTDPIEIIVATVLDMSNIEYVHESEDKEATKGLDFFLPLFDVYLEVKQFHTPRIAEQMSRAENVICIQGRQAAYTFAEMIIPNTRPR